MKTPYTSCLVVGIGLLYLLARPGLCQDFLPDAALRYLSYVDKFKSIELDVTTSFVALNRQSNAVGSSGKSCTAGRFSYDYRTGNDCLTSDPMTDNQGAYVEAFQEGARFRFNVEAKQGKVIRERIFWPLLPITLQGNQIGHYLGEMSGIGIPQIIERKSYVGKISPLGSNGFCIPSVFGKPGNEIAQDLVVMLDAEHQYCPSKIAIASRSPTANTFSDRIFDQGIQAGVWTLMVIEYATINGLDVPIHVVSQGGGGITESSASNIEVNGLDSPRLFQFPDDSYWVDSRDGSRHGDIAIVESWSKRQAKHNEVLVDGSRLQLSKGDWQTIPWEPKLSLFVWVGVLCVMILTAAVWKRVFYSLFILGGISLSAVGCGGQTSRPTELLVAVEPVSIVHYAHEEKLGENECEKP